MGADRRRFQLGDWSVAPAARQSPPRLRTLGSNKESTPVAAPKILKQLDQLNEFERQPVTTDKLHGGGYFAAVFSGEHIAATEFVIGALFVKLGAGAFDVLVGLLLGNLLAVLSWALVCAPIAVETRLTLYWYLRKIGGPVVMIAYNVLNAILFCILAGAMITVSASAVRIPFRIEAETHWYPQHFTFVLLVLAVGAVVVTLAVMGFKKLAQFSSVCSPWMVTMFIAGALTVLPLLGPIHSFSDFWNIAQSQIWTGRPQGQSQVLGFWHVTAFAWICNLATHLGLADMALFRYARRASYGFYSAFGMYLGHYLSWICAGIMGAAAVVAMNQPLQELDSGSIAYNALGAMGALTVVIAGWTTANPTLYRAGLALQAVTPGWPRWLVTLAVGATTTTIACFPFVFTGLLDFVGIYGLMLMPVGAIVVVEHWVFPRLGWTQYWASRKGLLLNWPALTAWGIALLVALVCWQTGAIHLFFLAAPVWLLTAAVYLVLAALAGARQPLPELPMESPTASSSPPPVRSGSAGRDCQPARWRDIVYCISGVSAAICLCLCLVLPLFVFFSSYAGAEVHRPNRELLNGFLTWVTLVYFISSVVWLNEWERRKSQLLG
jgi:cytosine permease